MRLARSHGKRSATLQDPAATTRRWPSARRRASCRDSRPKPIKAIGTALSGKVLPSLYAILGMKEHDATQDKRHDFPPEVIAHAVWLYCRFALRYRDIEELLAERGVILT